GNAEPYGSDVPGAEAGLDAQAGHDNEARPDAYGGNAIERPACILRGCRMLHRPFAGGDEGLRLCATNPAMATRFLCLGRTATALQLEQHVEDAANRAGQPLERCTCCRAAAALHGQ